MTGPAGFNIEGVAALEALVALNSPCDLMCGLLQ